MGCNTSVHMSLGISSDYYFFWAGLICCRAAWTNQSVNENKRCQIILMIYYCFIFFNQLMFLIWLAFCIYDWNQRASGVYDCWSGKKKKKERQVEDFIFRLCFGQFHGPNSWLWINQQRDGFQWGNFWFWFGLSGFSFVGFERISFPPLCVRAFPKPSHTLLFSRLMTHLYFV